MAQITWQKTDQQLVQPPNSQRIKFLIGGALIVGAVVYLIITGTSSGARYFITVDELVNKADYVGKTVRISGAVVGDSIQYDSRSLLLDFTIANIPEETQDLALTLHQAVSNPNTTRVKVHLENQVKPDLLQHESQAIVTGTLGKDGVFYATELLLKCPSRYDDKLPNQAQASAK